MHPEAVEAVQGAAAIRVSAQSSRWTPPAATWAPQPSRRSHPNPDVALVDIGLPDMTGYDVARTIRAVDAQPPMLLLAELIIEQVERPG